MIRATCALISCVVVAAFVRADDTAVKKDLVKLQGDWKVVKAINNGDAKSGDEIAGIGFVVKGDQMTYKEHPNDDPTTFKITLDPSATPTSIDFTKGKETIPGIYKLGGKTLTLCFKPESNDRPTVFESKKKSDVRLMVLERTKR